jgi:hypothetical protein
MRVINLRSIALEPRGSLVIIPQSSLIGTEVLRPKTASASHPGGLAF